MSKCWSCSKELPPHSRSCPACGSPVEASGADLTATSNSSNVVEASEAARAESASDTPSSGSPPGEPLAPGTLISGRYRLLELLGKGGMGEVYRADDLQLGHPVALKYLPPKSCSDAMIARLHNELRMARQIVHPNVARCFDIGASDGGRFLSMEFIDGEDLASRLRRVGRPPNADAVDIARQLCDGVGAAHDRGVVHRDLKPANVMIDRAGGVRITDFGLAGIAGDITGNEIRAGTPSYMSPEQIEGREVSVRSDIYSLGLIFYELFTGRRVFKADTPDEARRLHLTATPISPSTFVVGFDPSVERVILRCLDKDPKRRPQSARAVAAALIPGLT